MVLSDDGGLGKLEEFSHLERVSQGSWGQGCWVPAELWLASELLVVSKLISV